ncbi:MAG: hypothetical protein WBQ14_01005 [Gaiellaceae bacterium]
MSREVREIVREESWRRPAILEALASGPLTVPEIAAAIGCPASEAMYWVMGMRRYGYLREAAGKPEDGFFRYEAAERTGS